MANALVPPPLTASFGSIKDPKTGNVAVLDSSRDWIHWASMMFQSLARHFVSGVFRYEPVQSFAVGDTTPSVAGGNVWREVNTGATVITAFDDGLNSQEITILFTTGNTTITDGASLQLAGGVDFVGSANDILTLIRIATAWFEKSRSAN